MSDKTHININFSQGLNTKTDPWQLPLGEFLVLQNMIFQKGGLLQKRPGYGSLAGVPPKSSYLTTLNGNLISVGNTINAYSASTQSWITKGNLQPASVEVLPLVRNNLTQNQVDSIISNNLVCIVYTETNSTNSGLVTNYFYAIENATTSQNIVNPTAIPALSTGTISGSSRVFVVGNYFVIVSPVSISGTTFLQYFSVAVNNPTVRSLPQNTYPEAYVPITGNPGWDGIVSNNTLVLAYNTTAGGQGVHVTSLTQGQIASNSDSAVVLAFTNAAYIGALVSVCVDQTANPNIIYISFWNNATSNGYTAAVYLSFASINVQFNPQQIITATSISNLASAAQNGSCLVFSEVINAYSYDNNIPTNFIRGVSVSNVGSVGTPYVVIRSVGLASKAFIINGTIYFLSAFQSPFQPSYFLMNGSISTSASPVVVAKLAYQNGGGYLTLGLPNVSIEELSISSGIASIAYLFKQDVIALNTLNNPQQTATGGIYSQLGANLASFTIGTESIDSSEIARTLHLSGGFLGMFDGFLPVEHNFFLFPDSVEATYNATSTVTPTGTFLLGAKTIVVSSASGIAPGMTISDTTNPTYIPANTTVVYVNGTTLTISNATTHAGTTDTLSIQGNIAAQPDGATNTNAYFYLADYEWTDMQGNAYQSAGSIPISVTTTSNGMAGTITLNIPTLRLTSKISNKVKIGIYRWSVANQVYTEVTSIMAPLLNDTTIDSVSFVDTLPDSKVIGNTIFYTTGGVVADTNAPASNILTIFDTRLWLVDAEDPNVLWVSKTVIEKTPVEMSSEFTIYVAPNIGTTETTGPITALAPLDDKLIIFKNNSIFFINGTGPDNLGTTSPGCPLGNYSPATFITSVVGCQNQASLVLTDQGLLFQSDKGIWLLGRNLQTTYIGAPVEQFNESLVTSSSVVPNSNYVLFTLNTGEMLMYDYFYNQWGAFIGVPSVSSCIYNNLHTVLTEFGQIWQQTPNSYLDGSNPVLMNFTTSWINLASLQGYERFYEFYILAKYLSPHTLVAKVAYDYNDSVYHQSQIFPQNFSPSIPSSFGVPTPFGSPTNLEQWRIHTKVQLCQSFQLSLQEVFNPAYGTVPGAGFTMSGIDCKIGIKKATRPIRAANTVG